MQVVHRTFLSLAFHRWKMASYKAASHVTYDNTTAKLKLRICELEAQLGRLLEKDDIASSLAAEKALNR